MSADEEAIYKEAAAGQTYLVKEILVDRANSLFIQLAVGASIAAQHGALRAGAVLREARGDGSDPSSIPAIRTMAILTVLSLHLGACFCAVGIFQGISHDNAAKVGRQNGVELTSCVRGVFTGCPCFK